MQINIIARIENGFHSKFGIPRQSGLCSAVSKIVFEPEFRSPEAIRGIDGFSHLWLIWEFTHARSEKFRPTVRPPRLGGNTRVGVFATRSPFRPNPLGLSCVRLIGIERSTNRGEILLVSGADLENGTPIYDIKPYIPYADSYPDAIGGFADSFSNYSLEVVIPPEIQKNIREEDSVPIRQILKNDPRPSYQDDPDRIYCFEYKDYSIGFRVVGDRLEVTEAERSLDNEK